MVNERAILYVIAGCFGWFLGRITYTALAMLEVVPA